MPRRGRLSEDQRCFGAERPKRNLLLDVAVSNIVSCELLIDYLNCYMLHPSPTRNGAGFTWDYISNITPGWGCFVAPAPPPGRLPDGPEKMESRYNSPLYLSTTRLLFWQGRPRSKNNGRKVAQKTVFISTFCCVRFVLHPGRLHNVMVLCIRWSITGPFAAFFSRCLYCHVFLQDKPRHTLDPSPPKALLNQNTVREIRHILLDLR